MIVEATHLTRTYGTKKAVDGVTLSLDGPCIYGLLGRNGSGKTTLMSVLSGQEFPSRGSVRIFGENPVENANVLERICFIRENQRYPDESNPTRVFQSAALMYPNWDGKLAAVMADEFEIPPKTPMKKLSRGQFSAVGVILGLASGAPLTFFDEPYLGLDAVARRMFYRRLVNELESQPRTAFISSHLIDEIANLVGHVLLLDHGQVVLNMEAEEVASRSVIITGPTALVEEFVEGKQAIGRETLGGISRITLFTKLTERELSYAHKSGVEITPAPLQDVMIDLVEPQETGA